MSPIVLFVGSKFSDFFPIRLPANSGDLEVASLSCPRQQDQKDAQTQLMYHDLPLILCNVLIIFVCLCCRQAPGDAVHMWGKLYWVNDSPSTMNHNWHIHERAVSWGIGLCGGVRVCELRSSVRLCVVSCPAGNLCGISVWRLSAALSVFI